MIIFKRIWQRLAGIAVIFSPRPAGSYTQFLTDTVCYHH